MSKLCPSVVFKKPCKLCARFALFVLLLPLLGSSAWADPVLVTGRPASVEFLKEVLSRRGWQHYPRSPLRPGASWKSPSGQRVINLDWSAPTTSVAALSDHPEDVARTGMLFSGGLTTLRPVRLQYYHLGSLPGTAPNIRLYLTNTGAQNSRLYLRKAAGEPSEEYVDTGHGNNVNWFARDTHGEGEFVDLAPGSTAIIHHQDMPLHKVVSGTVEMTLVEGPPLQFNLVSARDRETDLGLNNLLKESDVHSRGFYPVATQRVVRTYNCGDPELKIAVGALRQATFSGVRELRGDYGVVYDLDLTLVNPTSQRRKVELLFNPRGGDATATFISDGDLIEIPRTEAFKEVLVQEVWLEPTQSKQLHMQTIPEGASSYPIRLVVRD